MVSLQQFIGNTDLFKKFTVNELLFVEYICPPLESAEKIWSEDNFFVYILGGETKLKTPRREYIFKTGDCAFFKKGSVLIETHFAGTFCQLMVFVPDAYIKSVIQKYKMPLTSANRDEPCDVIIPLVVDNVLETYFLSLLPYFTQSTPPPRTLLNLKFEELIVNILSSNHNQMLKCYLSEIGMLEKTSIKEIMESNFTSNLSMEQFAELCTRSLSSFKQEFKNLYRTTPGKWLQEKRLEYSKYLLENTDKNVDEVGWRSGFENRSHFIRIFKNKYGVTPGKVSIRDNSRQKQVT